MNVSFSVYWPDKTGFDFNLLPSVRIVTFDSNTVITVTLAWLFWGGYFLIEPDQK